MVNEEDRWTWLKRAALSGIIGTIIGLPVDVLLNNSGVLRSLQNAVEFLLFASVRVWEVLLTLTLLSALGFAVRWYFDTDHRTDRVLGIDWISEWDGREPIYLKPVCPNCGVELDITSETLGSQRTNKHGGRGIESHVCASASCTDCDFETKWEDVTGVEYHTVNSSTRANLSDQLEDIAKKKIDSRRRR